MQKKVAVQLGVIAVSSIALVFMSVPLFKGTGAVRKPLAAGAVPGLPRKTGSGKPDLSGQTIKVQHIKDDKFYERLDRVAETLPLARDPFSFAYTGPKSLRDGLELTGILWEEEKPTAIINQDFFKVGDSSGQFSVIKILQDRVVLKDRTGEFELRLKR